jgi:hypothetical protein
MFKHEQEIRVAKTSAKTNFQLSWLTSIIINSRIYQDLRQFSKAPTAKTKLHLSKVNTKLRGPHKTSDAHSIVAGPIL